MRVLWISNILLPDLITHIGCKGSFGGGWMSSLAEQIQGRIQLGVFSLYKKEYNIKINNIHYFTSPSVSKNYWEKLIEDFKPDIIHIHGTEYPHTLLIKKYSKRIPCVASIQGLVSVYSRYAYGGLNYMDIIKSTTIKDFIKRSSPISIKRKLRKNGFYEVKLIRELDYIIGRTNWDYSHAIVINPKIKYFKCNECIRNEFYEGVWDYNKIIPYSIFCSNSSVPLKGIHQVVKAMTIVRKQYPNVKIRIAGKNILGNLSFKEMLRLSGYDNYLRKLIYSYKLQDNVEFLGSLTALQMKEELLKCNVYILPSSIENSPNTLAEAQLLGTPIIASFVGGNMDMIPNKIYNMYRFEEIEMLAQNIKEVFKKKDWDEYICESQNIAHDRHDKKEICNNIISIYSEICKND